MKFLHEVISYISKFLNMQKLIIYWNRAIIESHYITLCSDV